MKGKKASDLKKFLINLYNISKRTNRETGKVSFELDECPDYRFEIIAKRLK